MYDYIIKYSNRKTVSLQISEDGELIVKAPYKFSQKKIEKLINEYSGWIDKNLKKHQELQANKVELSDADIVLLKDIANNVLPAKTEYFAKLMGVEFGSVKITSAQKRFGSCSGKNNICYSFILMLYPEKAIDYVVIHELSHTVHHNHSKQFYDMISEYMPDYKNAEKLLKGKQKIPYRE